MPQPSKQADSVLQLIGRTPVVRLRSLPQSGSAEVWAKCEQFNPAGSVMDRVALALIEAAERDGRIRRGESVIVEATTGNTGIGLALVCAAKGYPLIVTMPESMSLERRALLKAYGAQVVLTPAEQAMQGALQRAEELCKTDVRYFMPRQFNNPATVEAHRRTTARELVEQLGPKGCQAVVAAVGTGGTISGVGAVFKEQDPGIKVVAVEPERSAVLAGAPPGPHKIQGIGVGFIPETLERSVIDEVRTVSDRNAYETKVRLAKEEGLLVGISSGANAWVACEVARELGAGHRVLTFMCDTGERYFSLDEYFA